MALSGGSDSMALLHLTLAWAAASKCHVSALVVDHQLRAGSSDEASAVAGRAEAAGATSTILRWDGPHPSAGIQEAARDARYSLMIAWCRGQGVGDLLVGHQMEDQAATVLMRIQRGSGVDGLAAMAAVTPRDGIRVHRPMLKLRREELRTWLQHRGIEWVEDPTNSVERYERNRLDDFLGRERGDDDLVEKLSLLAQRQASASDALEQMAQQLWQKHRSTRAGRTVFPASAFHDSPAEIRLRLLRLGMQEVTAEWPRRAAAEALLQALGNSGKANAGGVLVRLTPASLEFTREPPRRN